MRKALTDYLPPILLQTVEFPLLCLTEQPEILFLLDAVEEVLKNQFVETATERAIQRYESIFKIVPKDTQTLEERRIEILAKMNLRLPYTIRMLRTQLEKLCGADGFQVTVIPNEYLLTLELTDKNKNYLLSLTDLLRRMIPANMTITAKAVRLKEITSIYVGALQIGNSSRSALPVLEPEQSLTDKLFLCADSNETSSRSALPIVEPKQSLTENLLLCADSNETASRSTLPPTKTDQRLDAPITIDMKPSGYCSRAVLLEIEVDKF